MPFLHGVASAGPCARPRRASARLTRSGEDPGLRARVTERRLRTAHGDHREAQAVPVRAAGGPAGRAAALSGRGVTSLRLPQ
jgi:hypothetical protein